MEIHPRVYNRTKKIKKKYFIIFQFKYKNTVLFKKSIHIYIYKNTLTTSVESCLTNACTDNLLGFKATYQITFMIIQKYKLRGLSFCSIYYQVASISNNTLTWNRYIYFCFFFYIHTYTII